MAISDPDMWSRISAHDFGRIGNLTLADRVTKMSSLTAEQAQVAVQEYRRFLYLAATGNRATVPSRVVDLVWHLHLLDTRNYVEDLCGKTIGRMIHHTPGRPAPKDDPGYPATLARYTAEFGKTPHRIWPSRQLQNYERIVIALFFAGMAFALAAFSIDSWVIGFLALVLLVVPAALWIRYGPWRTTRVDDRGGAGCGTGDGCGGGE